VHLIPEAHLSKEDGFHGRDLFFLLLLLLFIIYFFKETKG